MARIGSLSWVYAGQIALAGCIIGLLIVSSISLNNIDQQNNREALALTQAQQLTETNKYNAYLDANTTTLIDATGTCTWTFFIYAPNGTAIAAPTYTGYYEIQSHTALVTFPETVTERVAQSVLLHWPEVTIYIDAPIAGITVTIGKFTDGTLPFVNKQFLPLGSEEIYNMNPNFPSCDYPLSECGIGTGTGRVFGVENWFTLGKLYLRNVMRSSMIIVDSVYTEGFVFSYYNYQNYLSPGAPQFPMFSLSRGNATTFRLSASILEPLIF